MTTERPQHALMAAAAALQRREAQLLAREWLTSATRLADATGPLRIRAAMKLATVPERTRLLIDKHAAEAIGQFGRADTSDQTRRLAVTAVAETALALEARDTLTDEEFERLTRPWATVVGHDLIDLNKGI